MTSISAPYRFMPLAGLSRWMSFQLALLAVSALTLAGLHGHRIYLLKRPWYEYASGNLGVQDPILELNYRLTGYCAFAFTTALLVCVIVYLFWVYRATANIWAIRPDAISVRPGRAVAWNLIPIIWIWSSYSILRQIWCASAGIEKRDRDPMTRIFRFWWVFWGFANLYFSIAYLNGFLDGLGGYTVELEEPLSIINGFSSSVVASVFLAASCFFLFRIIREITRAQATLASNTAGVFE